MRFRLLSFVSSVVFLVASNVLAQEVTPHSYRGQIPALSGVRVSDFDIRADGRYLFYSSGGSSWNVVDLLDMITIRSSAVSTDGNVVGLFYLSNQLFVVTTKKIEVFDVEKVFAPTKEDRNFEFNDETQPMDACLDSSGRIYVLESESDNGHIVRVISTAASSFSEQAKIEWRNIFSDLPADPDDILPIGLRCGQTSVVVFGMNESEEDEGIAIGRISGTLAGPAFLSSDNFNEDYKWKDSILDSSGQRIFNLFNRRDEQGDEEDSLVMGMSVSNLAAAGEMEIGGRSQILASFTRSSQSILSFFVGRDYLDSSVGNLPTNKVLQIPVSSFGDSSFDFGDRGVGSSNVGSRDIAAHGELALSLWLGTNSDHYQYGRVEQSGISLLTNAPRLELVGTPANTTLSASNPIDFEIRADELSNYQIYFDSDLDPDGEAESLTEGLKRQIASGSLEANQAKRIQIRSGDLGSIKDGNYRLVILAERKSANLPSARLGMAFHYDLPPPAVENLHLGYGDRSLHVFFRLPRNPGDLKEYLIFVSKQKSDLDSLPSSNEDLEAWNGRFVRGHANQKINIPIRLAANRWDGSYVIAPLQNNDTYYVRVVVVDKTGNFSESNPAAVSAEPRATKSLSSAFGSGSCFISERASAFHFALSLILLALLFIGLRRSFKI